LNTDRERFFADQFVLGRCIEFFIPVYNPMSYICFQKESPLRPRNTINSKNAQRAGKTACFQHRQIYQFGNFILTNFCDRLKLNIFIYEN
jgi:hypothetical protein